MPILYRAEPPCPMGSLVGLQLYVGTIELLPVLVKCKFLLTLEEKVPVTSHRKHKRCKFFRKVKIQGSDSDPLKYIWILLSYTILFIIIESIRSYSSYIYLIFYFEFIFHTHGIDPSIWLPICVNQTFHAYCILPRLLHPIKYHTRSLLTPHITI